jgi:hypothetical protein
LTATLVAFKPGASTQAADIPVEPKHLLRIIEKQPGCLMRVGLDGLLLAVNEAAMQLLGATELSQVVGTRLTKLVLPRYHEQWDELSARVRDGAAASIECELTDLVGMRRTILIQAVPLLDHPDGVASMIAVARDSSVPRRLEASLREREVSEELGHLQKQLETGVAKPEAKPAVEKADALEQKLVAEHAAELARLRQTLAEEHQLALMLKDHEAKRLGERYQSELAEAVAGHQRLSGLLAERAAEGERVAAQHSAELSGLRQTLAEEHQLALLLKDQEARRLQEAHRAELEQAVAESARLVNLLEETRQLQDQHRGDVEQASAETARLLALVEERETYYQGVVGEHVAACAEAEQAAAEALTKQSEIEKALADQRVKLEALDQNSRNIEWLAAVGRAGYEIGRELQTILNAIDARTEFLLAESQLEAAHRHVVEALRGDAVTAASLARQIVLANTVTEIVRENASGDAGREL